MAQSEMLMIVVGRRTFALPLAEVRHIVPLQPEFCCAGADSEAYFPFEGEPVPFVSSWNHMGQVTAYQEYAELNALLPQRRQDHLDWMAALESSIRHGHPFSRARSPFDCAFGKWYYSYRTTNRQLAPLLKSFDQPHARIHALADQLLGLVDVGKKEDALERFHRARATVLKELLSLFDEATRLTISLQRRVAILLRDGQMNCALGADAVNDIATLPPGRLTRPPMQHKGTEGSGPVLAILEDESVVPFLDWKSLLTRSRAPGLP
jgi:chemotaxis signal transduction protein